MQRIPNTADHAFKNKDYRKALAGYTRAIEHTEKCDKKKTPWDPILWSHYEHRAQAAMALGDVDRAARDLVTMDAAASHRLDDSSWIVNVMSAALEGKPNDASYRRIRANALEKSKEFQRALADRTALVELATTKTERAKAYRLRASVHRRLAQPKLALQDWAKAIELEPKNWLAYDGRAFVFEQLQRPQAAVDDLSRALALMPPKHGSYRSRLYQRGELYRTLGQFDRAHEDFSELIKTDPKDTLALSRRLLVLLEQGRDPLAEADRARLKSLKSDLFNTLAFRCDVEVIRSRRKAGGSSAVPDSRDMRRAWTMGEIIAIVPLRQLTNKLGPKARKSWQAVSEFVRSEQRKAGEEARGLDPLPDFKGPKRKQAKQAIAFIFRQRKTVADVVARKVGEQVRAVFVVSTAGHMIHGLNRIGVPNLNRQLLQMIEKHAPKTSVPCSLWSPVAGMATRKKIKAADATAAWGKVNKAFGQFLKKP